MPKWMFQMIYQELLVDFKLSNELSQVVNVINQAYSYSTHIHGFAFVHMRVWFLVFAEYHETANHPSQCLCLVTLPAAVYKIWQLLNQTSKDR